MGGGEQKVCVRVCAATAGWHLPALHVSMAVPCKFSATVLSTMSLLTQSLSLPTHAPYHALIDPHVPVPASHTCGLLLRSDRPFQTMLDELKRLKEEYPDRILIASIMEEYNK